MIAFDESFNWLAVLKDLAAGMEVDRETHRELCSLAGNWPTCACGQLCRNLPRNSRGRPEDGSLQTSGILFYEFVRAKHWTAAAAAFRAIETRTTELLEKQDGAADPR